MIFDVTRESLAEGLDVDFMTGEYPYKNRLATAMVPLLPGGGDCRSRWHHGSTKRREMRRLPAA